MQFNDHNKKEFPPAHTAEHLLNQTMHRFFGCPRSSNAHIERKKSKISFELSTCPSEEDIQKIVQTMNDLIQKALPVNYQITHKDLLPKEIQSRLPEGVSKDIRLVMIGDYDICPCIGEHVHNTSEIGEFILLGTNWNEEKKSFRIRFKVAPTISSNM